MTTFTSVLRQNCAYLRINHKICGFVPCRLAIAERAKEFSDRRFADF
jgi:hypothetical protein